MPSEQPGAFGIDAKPTDDEDYNWMHVSCETIATGVLMYHDPVGQKIVGIFRMYRDFLEENLEEVDWSIEGERFVAWLRNQSETRGEVPGEWEGDAFEALDDTLIEGVEERGLDPKEAYDLFDQWVEATTDEFEQMHDMEGWFDDVE